MRDLRGPAAVNEELFLGMPLRKSWEGQRKVMIREPEDLHEIKRVSIPREIGYANAKPMFVLQRYRL